MDWIKADEENPLFDGRYVVWCGAPSWEIAFWFHNSWSFSNDALNCCDVKVTHWLKINPPN